MCARRVHVSKALAVHAVPCGLRCVRSCEARGVAGARRLAGSLPAPAPSGTDGSSREGRRRCSASLVLGLRRRRATGSSQSARHRGRPAAAPPLLAPAPPAEGPRRCSGQRLQIAASDVRHGTAGQVRASAEEPGPQDPSPLGRGRTPSRVPAPMTEADGERSQTAGGGGAGAPGLASVCPPAPASAAPGVSFPLETPTPARRSAVRSGGQRSSHQRGQTRGRRLLGAPHALDTGQSPAAAPA
ncbi:translation initiation factor IF-2 [Desmodus rotundus]|uniref:translation initiation factor IF-2 n=1 Tax=Desmodus rotundus TaxID=9430 RepID=UPI0023814AA2|nr:sterile alpha motif domain-containing protein 1-like [Desmodus rotundus]